MDSFCTSMVDANKCINIKVIVSIWLNVQCDGMFLKRGNDISDGACLLMEAEIPFKNIPIVEWLL